MKKIFEKWAEKIKKLWKELTDYQKSLLAVFLFWGGYLAFLFPRMIFRTIEGIWAGGINVWGDWPAHFALAMPFAYGEIGDWFSSHPLFLERKLTYPFLMDAFSGWLIRLGMDLTTAFWLPSLMAGLFLLWVLHKIAFQYSRSILQSFLVVTIFLASGGLGFIFFLEDFGQNKTVWPFPPREYTHIEEAGIFWINTIASEFVPQRSFPAGMACALLLLSVWIGWMKNDFSKISPGRLVFFGFLTGLMPIVHTHSFLVLFWAGFLFLVLSWRHWRKWLCLVVGTLASFLPIYFFFYHGQLGAEFFSWHPGWMADKPPFLGNWVYFWLMNWGIFLPLAAWSAWKTGFFRQPIFLLGAFLFLLGNLFLFQPWDWDNSKILTFSYFFLALPTGIYLGQQLGKSFLPGIVALICLEILIFSGGLDLFRAVQTEKVKNLIWNRQELLLAEKFRQLSRPGEKVLTSDQHNHPIRCLTGARTLMAYRGWLWSYGIDYAKVEREMEKMFAGSEAGDRLLLERGISFVFIGPSERNDWNANEDYFRQKYPVALENSDSVIFRVGSSN